MRAGRAIEHQRKHQTASAPHEQDSCTGTRVQAVGPYQCVQPSIGYSAQSQSCTCFGKFLILTRSEVTRDQLEDVLSSAVWSLRYASSEVGISGEEPSLQERSASRSFTDDLRILPGFCALRGVGLCEPEVREDIGGSTPDRHLLTVSSLSCDALRNHI